MVRKIVVVAFAASSLALFTQCSSGGSGTGGKGGGSTGGSGTGGSNGGGSASGGSSAGGSSAGGSHTGGSSAGGSSTGGSSTGGSSTGGSSTGGSSTGGSGAGGGSSSGGNLGKACALPDNGTDCGTGLSCVGVMGATQGFCSADCTSASCASGSCVDLGSKLCVVTCAMPGLTPTDCPSGDVCAATGGGMNICIPNCNTSAGECGTGEGCSASNGFCTAVGDAGFGQACDQMNACQQGFDCIQVSANPPHGFCSQDCSGSQCPASPAGAQCAMFQGGQSFCVFPCNADGGTPNCPSGLFCAANGANSICD